MGFLGNLFRRKESRTAGVIYTPTYGGAIWSDRRYDVFARETYMKNVIAFRAISEIAMGVATPPWGTFRRVSADEVENVDSHWSVDLVKKPNPQESWTRIMLKLAAFYVLNGNVFAERVKALAGPYAGVPKELYVHRPDRIQLLVDSNTNSLIGYNRLPGGIPASSRYDERTCMVKTDLVPLVKGGRLVGYRYTVGGRHVDWEMDPTTHQCDLYHMKAFHPLNDFWGAAPTESMAREIDTSNEATEWNKKMLQNEGRPGLVVTIVGEFTPEQFEEYERRLKNEHSGPENAGSNLILVGDRGTKAEPYAWSPKEMDFLEGNREWARRISLGYGVPPMLLGIPGDNTYSNQKEARLALWEGTILYHLRYFRNELNNWLFRKDGPDKDIFLDFDLDEIPALEPRRDALWERAEKADFLKINEKRAMVGLESIGPAGDVVLVPATMIPLGGSAESEEEEGEEDEKAIQALMSRTDITREEAEKLIGCSEDEDEEDEGDEKAAQKYHCECIRCGKEVTSPKHCRDIKCPDCGGEMRRTSRPGPGR